MIFRNVTGHCHCSGQPPLLRLAPKRTSGGASHTVWAENMFYDPTADSDGSTDGDDSDGEEFVQPPGDDQDEEEEDAYVPPPETEEEKRARELGLRFWTACSAGNLDEAKQAVIEGILILAEDYFDWFNKSIQERTRFFEILTSSALLVTMSFRFMVSLPRRKAVILKLFAGSSLVHIRSALRIFHLKRMTSQRCTLLQ